MWIFRFAVLLGLSTFALLCSDSATQAAPTTIVSSCGVVLQGDAELQADLDCSAYDEVAIRIIRGTLRLNGFTITGNPANTDPVYPEMGLATVLCEQKCRVLGPGTITGSGGGTENGSSGSGAGEALEGWRRLDAENVTLEGNGGTAVGAGNLVLRGCVIRNNVGNGVSNHQRARVLDTQIENNGLRGITGINGTGGLRVSGSSITGNAGHGVAHYSPVQLRNSVVSGNAFETDACTFDATTPSERPCVDLFTDRKPGAHELVCDTSYQRSIDGPSGVCALD